MAPDLNPVEGIWSVLKRGPLANCAFTGPGHLLQVSIRVLPSSPPGAGLPSTT